MVVAVKGGGGGRGRSRERIISRKWDEEGAGSEL